MQLASLYLSEFFSERFRSRNGGCIGVLQIPEKQFAPILIGNAAGMRQNTFLKGCLFYFDFAGAHHFYIFRIISTDKNTGLGIPIEGAILKQELFYITHCQQRNIAHAFLAGKGHIFKTADDLILRIASKHTCLTQIAEIAIFKGDLLEGSLDAPAVQSCKFQTDRLFYLLEPAIPNYNIFG